MKIKTNDAVKTVQNSFGYFICDSKFRTDINITEINANEWSRKEGETQFIYVQLKVLAFKLHDIDVTQSIWVLILSPFL